MALITVTEALQEIKTIDARIAKKRNFVKQYLVRPAGNVDPLVRSGGAEKILKEELQSIRDLEERKVLIRRKINELNLSAEIMIRNKTRSIADWLIWRREVASGTNGVGGVTGFLNELMGVIAAARKHATAIGGRAISGNTAESQPQDIIVHIDEQELAKEAELHHEILSVLDGQLSLKNATLTIDI